jgi:hypothetical protein
MRVRALLTALGLNAVPAAGWFLGDWSAGTTLVVYWLETLIGSLLVGARIVLHRRILPSKGHWDYRAPAGHASQNSRPSTYLSAFLIPALVFTFAHGVFLAALGGMMIAKNLTPEAWIDSRSVVAGLIGLGVFQSFDFVMDAARLRSRPFSWIERLGQQSFGRVGVVHFTIIGGMCAVMFTGANRHFFGVFIVLKTLLNASLVLPEYKPKTPPAWLSRVMDRIKSPKYKNTSFSQFWLNTDAEEEARVTRNEKPAESPAKASK